MQNGLVTKLGDDPIIERRRAYGRAASKAKRVGYISLVVSLVACVVGLLSGFSDFWGWLMIASLAFASVCLLPAIVVAYAVKAADRHDLGLPDGH